MASDYAAIRTDNKRRYGTDIGRIGPILLADRYDDLTHFIFELLQNAEDALARRPGWEGSRAVDFALSQSALRVSHSGKPFDDLDVRGICGIAESNNHVAMEIAVRIIALLQGPGEPPDDEQLPPDDQQPPPANVVPLRMGPT